MAERDLAVLLRGMEPVQPHDPFGTAVWTGGVLPFEPFPTVAEGEGLTVVAHLAEGRAAGRASDPWARISLTIQSDLAAVGPTAALAAVGDSANVIAGVHHDHIFLGGDQRHAALDALRELARA